MGGETPTSTTPTDTSPLDATDVLPKVDSESTTTPPTSPATRAGGGSPPAARLGGYQRYQPCLAYAWKWRGKGVPSPPLPPLAEVLWSFAGSFSGIAALAALTYNLLATSAHPTFLLIIGSMGATAVLVYAVPAAPLSQPRNVFGGHVISAVIGVAVRVVIAEDACAGDCLWLGAALSVSLAIAAMQATGTLHPPGGATALIAVTGGSGVVALGWWYILFPAAIGAVLMVFVGLLVNNLSPGREYPQRWL